MGFWEGLCEVIIYYWKWDRFLCLVFCCWGGGGVYVPCEPVEIRGKFHGVIFFLPSLCGLWGLNLGYWDSVQVCLSWWATHWARKLALTKGGVVDCLRWRKQMSTYMHSFLFPTVGVVWPAASSSCCLDYPTMMNCIFEPWARVGPFSIRLLLPW